MEGLHKLFRLSHHERVALLQAWGLFLLVELALRILPFTYLLALSKQGSPKPRGDPTVEPVLSVSRLAWLVEVAGRYTPIRATCLKKALVLSWLLGRREIPTELRIGVARCEGSLKAHAWLSYNGQVILGHQELEGYERLLHA